MTAAICPHCLEELNVTLGGEEFDRIIAAASTASGVPAGVLMSHSRRPRAFGARAAAMAVVRRLYDLSYPEIGEMFRRDHSTVHNAVRRADPVLVDAMLGLLAGDEATA